MTKRRGRGRPPQLPQNRDDARYRRETPIERRIREGKDVETELPLPWMPRFLGCLRRTNNASLAARQAGVSRQWAYKNRDDHPVFAALWDDALAGAYDLLEAKLLERATFGWDEPVFGSLPGEHSGTGEVGSKRKYDNRLGVRFLETKKDDWNRSRGDAVEADQAQDAAALIRAFVQAASLTVPGTKGDEAKNWGAQRMGDAVDLAPIQKHTQDALAGPVPVTTTRLCVDCGKTLEGLLPCDVCPPPEDPIG